MQSWNAAFFLFFFLAIRWGGGDLGSGSGSKFNRAARVGLGRVRQSRVRAGFGLQFWARADLYTVHVSPIWNVALWKWTEKYNVTLL